MYFGIYDNYTIRTLKPKGKKPILIRALEPSYKKNGKIPYSIKYIDQYVDVLELYFEDISDYLPKEQRDRFVLFNQDMAKQLIEFLNKNDFDEVITHCNAGVSRSSALMVCISRILGIPEIEDKIYRSGRFHPNTMVLNEVLKCDFKPKYKIYEHKIINTNEELWDEEECGIEFVKNEDGSFRFVVK